MTTATDIESPCVRVCTLDASGEHCLGCFRSLEEIAGWGRYPATEKRAVRMRAAERKRSLLGPEAERAP